MKINNDILLSLGAEEKVYLPKEFIFSTGQFPSYFYKIAEGSVKIKIYNESGKEFIYQILEKGDIICSSFLFKEIAYTVNAVALEESKIMRLPKCLYLQFLSNRPDLLSETVKRFSDDLHYYYKMTSSIALDDPREKILVLLGHLKTNYVCTAPYSMPVKFTRKQLGLLTGLSTETVIRVLKNFERDKIVQIKNRKVFY